MLGDIRKSELLMMWPQHWKSHLLSLSHIPDEHVLTSRGGNVPTLLSPSEGHEGYVGLLAADHSKHGAGNVAQVLLGQPHDQQATMTSASKEQIRDCK